MIINVTIKGRTPLLMCAFREEMLTTKHDPNATPREQAELFAYRDKKEELYIPAECIFASLIAAGAYHKLGKKQISTKKSSLIPSYISLEGDAIDKCMLNTKNFEVDSRSVVVPATQGRIMRHRPRLDAWETSYRLYVDSSGGFSEKLVRTLVNDSGLKCGVLAYRPSCKGIYGKFDVIKWEVEKEKAKKD